MHIQGRVLHVRDVDCSVWQPQLDFISEFGTECGSCEFQKRWMNSVEVVIVNVFES